MAAHDDYANLTLDEAVGLVRSFHQRIQAPIVAKPTLLARHPGKALGATIQVSKLAAEFAQIADGEKDSLLPSLLYFQGSSLPLHSPCR